MYNSSKIITILSPIALALVLSACGGGSSGADFGNGGSGGNSGSGSNGGSTGEVVPTNSLELQVSSRQLNSDGLNPVTITAIAKDSNNNAIENADIQFSVDKDATILTNATVTTSIDPNDPTAQPVTTIVAPGSIQTATLRPGSPMLQTLTVTVTSGDVSKSVEVEVVGTTLTIDGPSAVTINNESPFVLKLHDSSNKAIAYETVVLTSAEGNTITTDSNFQTDASGEIAFNLIGLAGGTDTITASVLGASAEKVVTVSGDEFVLLGGAEEIDINTNYPISFTWKKDGVPQVGQTITLSATRGEIQSQTAVTNSAGNATFYISSATAGQTVITATTNDGLSTTLEREFVSSTPVYLNTQADPTLLGPNSNSTIIAKIRDANDNPVKNKVIDFRLDDTVDGTLSGSTAVTDSLGRASVSYRSGNSSSAKDGVKITTFVHGYPAVQEDVVLLTVGDNALRLSLGDDNLLVKQDVFYVKQFGVIVSDSAGNPVAEQAVSFTITPSGYRKGIMVQGLDAWVPRVSVTCPSEDIDKDGRLDFGEDDNGNGTLEPTQDAVVTGSGVTDENGQIVVQVVYPKNTALWTEQRITASAVVDGTEYLEYTDFIPPMTADDAELDTTPPNEVSPYGVSSSCSDTSGILTTNISSSIIEAETNFPSASIENGVWYRAIFTDDFGNVVDIPYTVTSTVATVEMGPNNSFRVIDQDPTVDNSGFFLTLTADGNSKALFYSDDAATP